MLISDGRVIETLVGRRGTHWRSGLPAEKVRKKDWCCELLGEKLKEERTGTLDFEECEG